MAKIVCMKAARFSAGSQRKAADNEACTSRRSMNEKQAHKNPKAWGCKKRASDLQEDSEWLLVLIGLFSRILSGKMFSFFIELLKRYCFLGKRLKPIQRSFFLSKPMHFWHRFENP